MTTDGGGLVAERLQRSIIELRKVGPLPQTSLLPLHPTPSAATHVSASASAFPDMIVSLR